MNSGNISEIRRKILKDLEAKKPTEVGKKNNYFIPGEIRWDYQIEPESATRGYIFEYIIEGETYRTFVPVEKIPILNTEANIGRIHLNNELGGKLEVEVFRPLGENRRELRIRHRKQF